MSVEFTNTKVFS